MKTALQPIGTVSNMAGPMLHTDNFARMTFTGKRISKWMQARAKHIGEATATLPDPDVSIVIRTRNDGEHIERLFADIKAQIFNGSIEVIVVDTESRDDTVTYAKSQGAKIISLTQKDFNYPKALNMGFRAASHPWVVTLVGHSSLSSRLFLKSLTYWAHEQPKLGGVYGLPLANWNASRFERYESVVLPSLWKEPFIPTKRSIGIMGANCSIVKREVCERLGGYDERYGGGGEDAALADSMLAHGITIVREPLCSVFHSHGLSPINNIRQWLHWVEVGKKATGFETERVHGRRPDLR